MIINVYMDNFAPSYGVIIFAHCLPFHKETNFSQILAWRPPKKHWTRQHHLRDTLLGYR